MTDNEINRLVCEKVLGWTEEPLPVHKEWTWGDTFWRIGPSGGVGHTPDFCNDWRAFGLLWEALVKDERSPDIQQVARTARALVALHPYDNHEADVFDSSPCRALALAALKAYGVKEENI